MQEWQLALLCHLFSFQQSATTVYATNDKALLQFRFNSGNLQDDGTIRGVAVHYPICITMHNPCVLLGYNAEKPEPPTRTLCFEEHHGPLGCFC